MTVFGIKEYLNKTAENVLARYADNKRYSFFDCFPSFLSFIVLCQNLCFALILPLLICRVWTVVLRISTCLNWRRIKSRHTKFFPNRNSLFFSRQFRRRDSQFISLPHSLRLPQWRNKRKKISLCKVWQVRFNKWTTMLTQHVHKLHHKPRTPFVGSFIV